MFLVRGHIFQDTRHTGTLCSHGDQAHPANPQEHQKQERVEQHSPGYQDQDPPAVADRQSWNGATCEVWNLNTGRAGTIDWVEWDTCHKCYHGTCVRMGQGGHRSIPVTLSRLRHWADQVNPQEAGQNLGGWGWCPGQKEDQSQWENKEEEAEKGSQKG